MYIFIYKINCYYVIDTWCLIHERNYRFLNIKILKISY